MYTLLTGATGLVGRYLVRDLLLSGHQLAVVVRSSRKQSPRDRMEEILQHWERELGRPLARPVVLEGDIAEPGFGFSGEDRDWVGENCDKIIHSAAILEFYGKDRKGEPWRTNFNGTQNMINLCRELNILDIHYVSTAYVAGFQTERVMEDSLDVGQSFRNDYEESKFHAEKLVRAIDFADHVTIYRPAVISGDSRTGYTNTYHGLYLYLRLMSVMIPPIPRSPDGSRSTPIRLRMTGEEKRNIIPVDWVSAVMCRLFETPAARGKTFHIAPDDPITSRRMIEYCSKYFNSTGVEFCGPGELPPLTRDGNEDQWMFERVLTENATTYAPYESTDNVFDMTNTRQFAGDIVCPELDETIIFRYIDFGNEDRWGKRRAEVDPVDFWAAEAILSTKLEGNSESTWRVGLDVIGQGGAQLTVEMSRRGIHGVDRGLPREDSPVLRISNSSLEAICSGRGNLEDLVNGWDCEDITLRRELSEVLAAALQSREFASTQG
ncbi:MAG: SDR family oxidoreductase [Planctomycetota bacterium]